MDVALHSFATFIRHALRELSSFEALLAHTSLRVQLPYLGSHVEQVSIPRDQAGAHWGYLAHQETRASGDDSVEALGVVWGRGGDMVEACSDAAAEREEAGEVDA